MGICFAGILILIVAFNPTTLALKNQSKVLRSEIQNNFRFSLPAHLRIYGPINSSVTDSLPVLTGLPDPHVMVNKNQRHCEFIEYLPPRSLGMLENVWICKCWLIEYNKGGTIAAAKLPYAVTAEWINGQTLNTGLVLIDATVCSPRPCCSRKTLSRRKRDDDDEYEYIYEDTTDSNGLRAAPVKKKVKKAVAKAKAVATGGGLPLAAILGIVFGIVGGILLICGGILGYCYYLYKQEIARIRFRNRMIDKHNKKVAALRAAQRV
ncbi:uncharacterized protein LOC129590131 isoform X1 [Paramacrobiotus metropolitanus]|uniref:uncharacterized protein LOC129590131 isoform X1 n=1 Tax=Paramacrobiotus metropolitanus TaxID=2943436 RepID=UPI0024463F60|nr:uncharacterized protein LOC129590131 isoform X1 [Paramacrobiotus metropolitanus]